MRIWLLPLLAGTLHGSQAEDLPHLVWRTAGLPLWARRFRLPILVLLAGTLQAAVIRGTVVENQTGHPLAHASVLLEPVPGSPGIRMTGHTNRYGLFEFGGTAPGTYILQATRTPFLTAYYGQKRWNSAGMPLTVTESETQFVTIRMMRFAALAGSVVDENDVGQPQFEVAAYRDITPLQLVAHATADERGAYRIYGLLPGTYVVRSVGKELAGIGYKPTFAHETETVDQARTVDLEIEQEAREMNLRPLPGQLFSLFVKANPLEPIEPPGPTTLTLASEMGRQIVKGKEHTFTGLPRGDYDVFAEAPSDTPGVMQANYQRISLGKDTSVALSLRKVDPVSFQFEGLPNQAVDDGTLKLLGRRKDLAGTRDTQVITLVDKRAYLAVGPWELAVAPLDGRYVSGFMGSVGWRYRPPKHYDGWNEIVVMPRPYGNYARFTLSSGSGGLSGTVIQTGDPVAGAPVFLEPVDLEPERRITDTYVTITDIHGRYHFWSLAPGRYRVLSSFEYQMPDSKIMTDAHAKEVQIDVRTDIAQDLDLYVLR